MLKLLYSSNRASKPVRTLTNNQLKIELAKLGIYSIKNDYIACSPLTLHHVVNCNLYRGGVCAHIQTVTYS